MSTANEVKSLKFGSARRCGTAPLTQQQAAEPVQPDGEGSMATRTILNALTIRYGEAIAAASSP